MAFGVAGIDQAFERLAAVNDGFQNHVDCVDEQVNSLLRVFIDMAATVDRFDLDAHELDQPPGALDSSHQAFVTRLGLGIQIHAFNLPQQVFHLALQGIHLTLQALDPVGQSFVSCIGDLLLSFKLFLQSLEPFHQSFVSRIVTMILRIQLFFDAPVLGID